MIAECSCCFLILAAELASDEPPDSMASQRNGKDEGCARYFNPVVGGIRADSFRVDAFKLWILFYSGLPKGSIAFSGLLVGGSAALLD